jgi:hypothetical protein
MEVDNKMEYVRVEGSKNYSVVVSIPVFTNPGFMRQMLGGCSTADRKIVDN